MAATCSIETCDSLARSRGWCSSHYMRWYRYGNPEGWGTGSHISRPIAPDTRFWSKVDFSDPDGCWPWAGSYRHAYGEFWVDGKKAYAHRVAASLVHGDLQAGSVVLHKCDNPACVRPDHLAVGTQVDNMRDCAAKGRWRNQFAVGEASSAVA